MRPLLGKVAYELYLGKIPSIFHFKVFGSKCYIPNTKDQLNKFNSKNQNGIFLGYSSKSSSYIIYNLETHCVEESSDIVFDEVKVTKEIEIDYDEKKEEVIVNVVLIIISEENSKNVLKFHKEDFKELVIGSPLQGVQTRYKLNMLNSHWAFLSQVEPKNFKQGEKEESWMSVK